MAHFSKISSLLFIATLLLLLIENPLLAQSAAGEPVVVTFRNGELSCFENTVTIGHIADVEARSQSLVRKILALDLDSFGSTDSAQNNRTVVITKRQVQYRLMLAGVSQDQFSIAGPTQVVVAEAVASDAREAIENEIRIQLSEQYFIAAADLNVSLDERFADLGSKEFDYTGLRIASTPTAELSLGNQQLNVQVQNAAGEIVTRRVPVHVAMIRDLVVARQNISKGQTITADNVESVRRPVGNRNVRFASFEQVVGKVVQNDIQQYELLKSNVVRSTTSRTTFAIKKNAIVRVIARRGNLTVTLKDAKAMTGGNPGDSITLENVNTKERIVATVVDASTAEIRF